MAIVLLWGANPVLAEDVTDFFNEQLGIIEGGLGPGTVEGPYTIRPDTFSDRILVWEMGDPDVLRLFDKNFTNMTVLDLPIPNYDIKGVEFGDQGLHIIAWGRSPDDTNDTLAVYWSSNHTLDENFAPDGSLPLQTLDAVRSFDEDRLLAIGGRDANGTSRLMVFEMDSGWVLTDDPVAGNRSVVHIGTDGHSMVVLDDMSWVYVYQTKSWSVETKVQLFNGPIITSEIIHNRKWAFTSVGGQVAIWRIHEGVAGLQWINVTGDPIEGAASVTVPYHDALVISVPGEMSGSSLQIWIMDDIPKYILATVIPVEKSVTYIIGNPNAVDQLMVCFDDGSIREFQYSVEEFPLEEAGKFNIEYRYIIISIIAAIVLLFLYRRRKSK